MKYQPWIAVVLGLALGQATVDAQPTADLNGLVREMGERVQHLGEDIASEMGNTADVRHLLQDTRELANAINAFQTTLQRNPDPRQVGRSFASIETSWQNLQNQIARRGATPAVERSARRVAQVIAQLHQILGPDVFSGPAVGYAPEPGGSYYLDFGPRYQAPPVASAPLRNPGSYYLDFGPQSQDFPPAYGPPQSRVAMRPRYNPVVAVVPMADQLVAQTDDFLRRFIPLADQVPERNGFISDTRALRNAAIDLSEEARRGASPDRIAARADKLDRIYRRLNTRLNRVAKGRPPGPNIVAILQFGDTVQAIGQQLSGAPPFDGRPGFPR